MDTLRGVAASLLTLTFLHILLSSDSATGRAAGALSKVGTALGRITDPTVPLFGPRPAPATFGATPDNPTVGSGYGLGGYAAGGGGSKVQS